VQPTELILQFCKALADESRLKIVGALSGAERNVRELAELLDLKEPTISHHLRILKSVELVTMRVQGNTHWFALNEIVLRRVGRLVFNRESLARLADSVAGDDWERKVLHAFVDRERLLEIPAARKKRLVILKWLAACFETGANYSEAQVNATLKQHHGDCATLRRELVGCRLLSRERGIYRRAAGLPPSVPA
jgi:DNA-binding transcriptional ArsR family regulator